MESNHTVFRRKLLKIQTKQALFSLKNSILYIAGIILISVFGYMLVLFLLPYVRQSYALGKLAH